MGHFLLTSESVAAGHPDKIADQISDAILDACLFQDPHAKVACEVMVSKGLVAIGGEITTSANVDYEHVAREMIKEIGYNDPTLGFDYRSSAILLLLQKQSIDIAQGVVKKGGLGAGDQGMMFGYASDENEEMMPMPQLIANKFVLALKKAFDEQRYPYLLPDGKVQITINYDSNFQPKKLHTAVISVQHHPFAEKSSIEKDMKELLHEVTPSGLIDQNTIYYINPTGRFVIGGPASDCGMTGRKIIVDTYGGAARHGGGAFSGKDPTKVDRSGHLAARWAAKNVVAAGLARRCELQISYAIGISSPVSLFVETFGTETVNKKTIVERISNHFDFSPSKMIESLDLNRPIYKKTAFGGHFGRNDPDFTWERLDKAPYLR